MPPPRPPACNSPEDNQLYNTLTAYSWITKSLVLFEKVFFFSMKYFTYNPKIEE